MWDYESGEADAAAGGGECGGAAWGEEAVTKDGMEISLCVIDTKKRVVNFVSAMRPLYIIRNGEFLEIKGNKFSIGGYMPDKAFVTHKLVLNAGDTFY